MRYIGQKSCDILWDIFVESYGLYFTKTKEYIGLNYWIYNLILLALFLNNWIIKQKLRKILGKMMGYIWQTLMGYIYKN